MIKKLTGAFLVATLFVAFGQAPQTHAAEEKQAEEKNPYSYTAREGDNYTVLARKAVQTYGIRESIKLSLAQIVAAETTLASKAGFPELNVAEKVEFKSSDIKKVIDEVKKLPTESIALWKTYVPYINFNTDNNG